MFEPVSPRVVITIRSIALGSSQVGDYLLKGTPLANGYCLAELDAVWRATSFRCCRPAAPFQFRNVSGKAGVTSG